MSKNKQKVVWILSLILLIVLFCVFIRTKNTQTTYSKEEYEFIEYLVEEDSFAYDADILGEWYEPDKMSELEKKANDGESAFILGSLALQEGDLENAVHYFEIASKEVDNSDYKIKSRACYELSKCYIYMEEYEKAYDSIDKMTDIFDDADQREYQIQLNIWLSYDLLEVPGGVDKAISILEDSMETADEIGYSSKENILLMLARCYDYSGDFAKATQCRIEGLEYADKNNNAEGVLKISTDIGCNYLSEGNVKEAIRYLEKAYDTISVEKDLSTDDLSMLAYISDCLFQAYVLDDDLENAKKYLDLSQKYIEEEDEGKVKENDWTKSCASLAKYQIEIEEYDEALKSVALAEERYSSDDNFMYSNFDIELKLIYGRVYLGQGDLDKSLTYYKEVEKDFVERMGVEPDYTCLEGLYEIYREKGDIENASIYAEALVDDWKNKYIQQDNQQTSYMLEKFQNEQKESQIYQLEKRNTKQFFTIIIISIAFIFVLMFIFFIKKKQKEIHQLNKTLKYVSEHDQLTGLYNRRALEEYFENEWQSVAKQSNSVMMIDVDFFKKYNDYYGHLQGDKVLELIGKSILENIRENDFAVRYGGEEFLIVLINTTADETMSIAKDISNAVKELCISHEKSNVSDYVTISVGIASSDKQDFQEIIKEADDALYKAKKIRNTIVIT